jgi:hypothetical protein
MLLWEDLCKVEDAVDSVKLLRRLPSFCSLLAMALLFEKEEADIFREDNCEVWVPAAFDSFGASTTSPLGVPMRQPLS